MPERRALSAVPRSLASPTVLISAVVVVVATLAHVYAAWGSTGPVFYTDEVGYLANAQVMAGVGSAPHLVGGAYYIGWSILLVPLWWITQDPQQVYMAAVAISVVCGVAVIAPLASVARSLGMAAVPAVIGAAAISVAPSRLVMSNFALAENFLALLVACTLLAAFRFLRSSTSARAVVLVALSAALMATHARTAPILVASLLWVVIACWRRWATLALAAGTALLIAGGGFLLYRAVTTPMYAESVDREERGITRLLELDPFAALTAAVGQVWYLMAAWYGLALLGVILVGRRAVGEVRHKRPGIGSWAMIALLGIAAISIVWISAVIARGDHRYDIFAYGRYLDTVLFAFALVGLAKVAAGISRRGALAWAISALTIGGVFFLIVVPQVPTAPDTWWGPNSVAGLIQWDWPNVSPAGRPPWIAATLATGIVGVLFLVLSLRVREHWRAPVVVAVAFALLLGSGIAAEIRTIRPSYDRWHTSFGLRHDVVDALAANPDASLSFDLRGLSTTLGGRDTVSRNAYQFWLTDYDLPVFDSTDEGSTTDLVISRGDWPAGEALGALRIAIDTGFDNALWAMPGPLQDDLVAESGQ